MTNRKRKADYSPEEWAAFLQKRRVQDIAYRKRLKAEFLAAYGGKCACPGCPETDPVFMCLDHVDGGGSTDYRTYNNRTGTVNRVGDVTRQLIAKAKRAGWPKTYQPLCWNCNAAKHMLGGLNNCPHQSEREGGYHS